LQYGLGLLLWFVDSILFHRGLLLVNCSSG
jgi:hypothetical protein